MSDHQIVNHATQMVTRGQLDLVNDKPAEITKAQLKKIFTAAADDYLGQVAAELNTDLAKYGLSSALQKAHFFAQVREESGPAMKATTESLNYNVAGLLSTFSYYQAHKDEATADGRTTDPKTHKVKAADQEAIANKAYANRIGNGDAKSGDGWKFRGRGLKQVTGRTNYQATTKQYAKLYSDGVDFVSTPDLMAKFPYSVRSAVCFWIMNGLDRLADRGRSDKDVDAITEIMNKHTKSYEARRAHFVVAYDAFK
jgi:putative chitinase